MEITVHPIVMIPVRELAILDVPENVKELASRHLQHLHVKVTVVKLTVLWTVERNVHPDVLQVVRHVQELVNLHVKLVLVLLLEPVAVDAVTDARMDAVKPANQIVLALVEENAMVIMHSVDLAMVAQLIKMAILTTVRMDHVRECVILDLMAIIPTLYQKKLVKAA